MNLLTHEAGLRLGVFLTVLLSLFVAELLWARRDVPPARRQRWTANFGLVLFSTILLRLALPLGAVGAAWWAQQHSWGLFNLSAVPAALTVVIAVLALDFAIYLQHRVMHAVPVLWRLHRVHHSDTVFDVTTALRFHPAEMLLSMGYKIGIVILLGAPPIAVLIFEVLLNATAMFNHSNLRLPLAVDKALRYVLVTPDMHRVHHSWHVSETNSNYGFNLPWWDRLLGTYVAQPADGHIAMTIGLQEFRSVPEQSLGKLLTQPLIRHTT